MDDDNFSGLQADAAPKVTDWQAETETGIALERDVQDWRPFLSSDGVRQYQPGSRDYADKIFDTVSCVSFASLLGAVEAQANYLLPALTEGQRYRLQAAGFIGADGKVRLSVRWLAHVSGTTRDGNSFAKVLEALRRYGAIPAALWAFDRNLRTFEEWIARPAKFDEFVAAGKVWLEVFDLQYDWLFWHGLNLTQAQKLARIRAALPTCPVLVGRPWCRSCDPSQVKPGVPIQDCGKVTSGHATCIVAMQADGDQEARDTYPIFDRVFDDGYHVHHAFRAVLTVKGPAPVQAKPPAPRATCRLGDRTQAVAELQDALSYLGYLKVKSPAGKPYFGPLTQQALGRFQFDQKIFPTAPDSFGPRSLAAMRAILA